MALMKYQDIHKSYLQVLEYLRELLYSRKIMEGINIHTERPSARFSIHLESSSFMAPEKKRGSH